MAPGQKPRWSEEDERQLFTGARKYGIGRWKLISADRRYQFSDAHEDDKAVKRSNVEIKDRWRSLMNSIEGAKRIKQEVTKKNEIFRCALLRQPTAQGSASGNDRNQLKPLTKDLREKIGEFIVESLRFADRQSGQHLDQISNYCIERFRELDQDHAIQRFKFGGLFEICRGMREQRVPQRLIELAKEGKIDKLKVPVPGDDGDKYMFKYIAIVDEEEEEEEEEEVVVVKEEKTKIEQPPIESAAAVAATTNNTNRKRSSLTAAVEDEFNAEDKENKRRKGNTNAASTRKSIDEELEKLPAVFYYDGRYLTAETAANEAREAFEQAEIAANEAEIAEKEAADAEAEARQAAQLVEALCAEAEKLKEEHQNALNMMTQGGVIVANTNTNTDTTTSEEPNLVKA